MKRFKAIIMVLMMTMFVSSVAAVPAFAAGLKGEEFHLVNSGTGYKIIIPNIIEDKIFEVEVAGEVITLPVIVAEMPQKDAAGGYPIFEIVAPDSKADTLISFPGTLEQGQLGDFEQKFKDGRIVFNPQFTTELKDLAEDEIFIFDMAILDKDGNVLLDVTDINFMFVNKGAANKPAEETPKANGVSADPTASKVTVNGKEVAFEAYKIDGSNYFKLRDLAMVVNGTDKQFKVDWDSAKNAISLTAGEAYIPDGKELAVSANPTAQAAEATQSKIYLNGKEVQFTAYKINNNNYFKLRDIAKAINFAVTYDAKTSTVGIDTTAAYTE